MTSGAEHCNIQGCIFWQPVWLLAVNRRLKINYFGFLWHHVREQCTELYDYVNSLNVLYNIVYISTYYWPSYQITLSETINILKTAWFLWYVAIKKKINIITLQAFGVIQTRVVSFLICLLSRVLPYNLSDFLFFAVSLKINLNLHYIWTFVELLCDSQKGHNKWKYNCTFSVFRFICKIV